MQILDGKSCSEQIRQEIADQVSQLKSEGRRPPHLAAILVGNDGASETYVANKVKDCQQVGFESSLIRFDNSVSEEELLTKIAELNADEAVDGFIVQLPLPGHIDEHKVTVSIDPRKDVDGFCPENVGNLCLGLPTFVSATPNGIMELLARYDIETEGKHCVVLGRSNIVGTPMAILMSRNSKPGNSTVTLAHSRTANLKALCAEADILVAAIGKPEFVSADMVKPGAVVIDVGITRLADESRTSGFRLVGDVQFDSVAEKAAWITPVPGGVGPMTRASLLQNTLKAYLRN
ncbi:MAG: bifunctional methylenetetrahydrofolate dehydrogenase/methenyltetrahydrofolate cyclohydrolase FolD [Pseudomonadales bacterium]|nr:bifunctional methylenetetrahydrofolate dehydrogenase/methenyltetrahydrofolate cyclohydrolase FolD [Pseudomonadales bacterium]